MTEAVVVLQIGNLTMSIQVPKSQESDYDEDLSHLDSPVSPQLNPSNLPGKSAEESLMEALEYFRNEPVPVKKSRGFWPFKR
jgi:hypothetical protein